MNIPALTPAGLVEPNNYYRGGNEEPESIVLADSLPIYKDPRGDAEPAGPPFRYLQRLHPDQRIRSESDFDWLHIPSSAEHPTGGWIASEYVAPVTSVAAMPVPGESYSLGNEPVDKERALPPDYRPHDLVSLPASVLHIGKEVQVREPTARAIKALIEKAESQGLKLRVLSGFRPFEHQRKLYFEALAERGPKQNGTAMPGHSEHQLGTTVDFCGPNIRNNLNGSFAQTPEGKFLQAEAPQFGFRNSYTTENTEESGFKPEPWHWRHIQVNDQLNQ